MRPKQGDVAWLAIIACIIAYEFTADELLSEAAERYCAKHPWLTRLLIAAVAGHLACLTPPKYDIFNAENVAHKWAFSHLPTGQVA